MIQLCLLCRKLPVFVTVSCCPFYELLMNLTAFQLVLLGCWAVKSNYLQIIIFYLSCHHLQGQNIVIILSAMLSIELRYFADTWNPKSIYLRVKKMLSGFIVWIMGALECSPQLSRADTDPNSVKEQSPLRRVPFMQRKKADGNHCYANLIFQSFDVRDPSCPSICNKNVRSNWLSWVPSFCQNLYMFLGYRTQFNISESQT